MFMLLRRISVAFGLLLTGMVVVSSVVSSPASADPNATYRAAVLADTPFAYFPLDDVTCSQASVFKNLGPSGQLRLEKPSLVSCGTEIGPTGAQATVFNSGTPQQVQSFGKRRFLATMVTLTSQSNFGLKIHGRQTMAGDLYLFLSRVAAKLPLVLAKLQLAEIPFG